MIETTQKEAEEFFEIYTYTCMYYKIIAGSIMLMDYVDINSNCDCAVMQIYYTL